MIAEETVSDEDLSAEATAAEAPLAEPTKRTRKPKAEKVAKAPKEPKPPKAPKEPKTKIDKYVKNLVTAAASGLRAGTGRYQFLEASESAKRVSDLIGKEFQVGDKTVKLGATNIQGMFSRGHIALSADGETWERVQTTVVTE
jgi:hypothetical protein